MKASRNQITIESSEANQNMSADDFMTAWKQYADGELAQAATFDKVVTTLSAGALALSITFINQIAPNPKDVQLLGFAWLGFGLALVLNILSYIVGQFAFRRQAEILQDFADNQSNVLDQSNGFRTAALWLNGISALAFIGGVVAIGLFAWTNVNK